MAYSHVVMGRERLDENRELTVANLHLVLGRD